MSVISLCVQRSRRKLLISSADRICAIASQSSLTGSVFQSSVVIGFTTNVLVL